MTATLAAHSVSKRFGDAVALDDVTLSASPGEVFGLLGPNGAGKSTLIRIAMDIHRPDSGQLQLFGAPPHRDALERVGYLPEERGLYTRVRVIDVLTYFGELKGLSRADAKERGRQLLRRFDLEHVSRWQLQRLSKGMSQKVQLAATLLPDPELCILDEPFSGLDPVNVRIVRELIRERRERGLTTILSTHQMAEVEGLCDRVALLSRGRRVVYGSVDEVRRAHSQPRLKLRGFDALPAGLDVATAERRQDDWIVTLPPAASPERFLADLVGAGVSVSHFEQLLISMEDVFVQVVGAPPSASERAAAEA